MQPLALDQLSTFVAVVEAGSLTAAAPRVFLSQSAVSEQMRKLESRVGRPLLTRGKAGVLPTPAGERLLAHARRLLAAGEEALRDLRGESLDGELRLAITDYFRPSEVTRLLARLREHHPRVRLHVSIVKSGEVEARNARGEIDVGLSMRIDSAAASQRRTGSAPAGERALRTETLAWVCAPGMRRVRTEPLPLVALPDGCALHRHTADLLRGRGVPFVFAHLASGVAGLQAAVAAGLGIACLNESSIVEGMTRLPGPHGLPALPRVSFRILAPRRRESAFVERARALLAAQFA